MGKESVRMHGLNAGHLARVLVKQGRRKDEEKEKAKIRNQMKREHQRFIQRSCYQIELLLVDDEPAHKLLCADVHALFSSMAKASKAYGRLLLGHVRDSVLDLILYCDEVTPGNVLAPDASRKINSRYIASCCGVSCRQELTWVTVTSIRQKCVKKIISGMAAIINALLESFQQRNKPQLFQFEGRRIIFTYNIRWVVADEAALHSMMGCKGAAGRKPAFVALVWSAKDVASNWAQKLWLTSSNASIAEFCQNEPEH